jgi:hypothetical protein
MIITLITIVMDIFTKKAAGQKQFMEREYAIFQGIRPFCLRSGKAGRLFV